MLWLATQQRMRIARRLLLKACLVAFTGLGLLFRLLGWPRRQGFHACRLRDVFGQPSRLLAAGRRP